MVGEVGLEPTRIAVLDPKVLRLPAQLDSIGGRRTRRLTHRHNIAYRNALSAAELEWQVSSINAMDDEWSYFHCRYSGCCAGDQTARINRHGGHRIAIWYWRRFNFAFDRSIKSKV